MPEKEVAPMLGLVQRDEVASLWHGPSGEHCHYRGRCKIGPFEGGTTLFHIHHEGRELEGLSSSLEDGLRADRCVKDLI